MATYHCFEMSAATEVKGNNLVTFHFLQMMAATETTTKTYFTQWLHLVVCRRRQLQKQQ